MEAALARCHCSIWGWDDKCRRLRQDVVSELAGCGIFYIEPDNDAVVDEDIEELVKCLAILLKRDPEDHLIGASLHS